MGAFIDSSRDFVGILEKKVEEGIIRAIDLEIVRFFLRLDPALAPLQLAVVLLVSKAIGESHSCIDLDHVDLEGLEELSPFFFDRNRLVAGLLESPLLAGSSGASGALVMEGEKRVYFRKYHAYESRLASRIRKMALGPDHVPDIKKASRILRRLLPSSPTKPDWQKVACATALLRRFCVVTGGPGTGKTRTTAAMVALLMECLRERPVRIALCAPTGKAAARLAESVKETIARMDMPEGLRMRFPVKAHTIHRLLGAARMPGRFRFGSTNRLPFDVVIVDEASMVDLPLMVRLVSAMGDLSRLVLLGDKDQLSSVEAGNVLADICHAGSHSSYSAPFLKAVSAMTGDVAPSAGDGQAKGIAGTDDGREPSIRDCVVNLVHAFRFEEGGTIAEFASAVRDGDADRAIELLERRGTGDLKFLPAAGALKAELIKVVERNYLPFCLQKDPARCLMGMEDFRILCAVKEGPRGVRNINKMARAALYDMGLKAATMTVFRGMPIILNKNSHALGLYNGDTGIVWHHNKKRFYGLFPGEDGLRAFGLSRLPDFQESFSITVHKSQGSEYERCLVILPNAPSPILSRQLLYTAVTRARKRIVICARPETVRFCINHPVRRFSGLTSKLLQG